MTDFDVELAKGYLLRHGWPEMGIPPEELQPGFQAKQDALVNKLLELAMNSEAPKHERSKEIK